jgi:hypothetical protein
LVGPVGDDEGYNTPDAKTVRKDIGGAVFLLVAGALLALVLGGCATVVDDEEADDDESYNQCYPRGYYKIPCLPIVKAEE